MPDFHSNEHDDHDPFQARADEREGNRPASGARQASPGEVLSGGFQGSANAGDFLGLDLEVSEPGSEAGGLELASVDPYGAHDEPMVAHSYAHGDFSEDAPVDDFADEPLPMEDELLEEELDEELVGTKRSTGRIAALAFVVGLLAVAGAVLVPKYLAKQDAGQQVARVEPPKPAPRNDPATGTDAELAAAGTAQDDGETELVGTEADLGGPLGDDGETTFEPESAVGAAGSLAGGASDDSQDAPSLGDLFKRLTGSEEGQEAPAVSQLPRLEDDEPIGGKTFDASLFSPEAWMSGELVDMVWRDTSVPMEAIAHPARIMTPRVGPVRVSLKGGQVMEGRLYAVGQNRVWLESDMGRLGLDGDQVVSFQRLHPEEAKSDSFDTASVGTGKRVRVLVPGGVLYGRVLSVIDEDVVLVTDAGARVSLHAPKIEALGPSRAVLIER